MQFCRICRRIIGSRGDEIRPWLRPVLLNIVKSKKVLFEFSIRRNITVIKGDSATGKTILLRILYEYLRIGRQSGYAVSTNASYYVYI